jgi:hypothetical protein
LRFANLLPIYSKTKQLNASSYEKYVEEYVAALKPDVLCTDIYPFFNSTGRMHEL